MVGIQISETQSRCNPLACRDCEAHWPDASCQEDRSDFDCQIFSMGCASICPSWWFEMRAYIVKIFVQQRQHLANTYVSHECSQNKWLPCWQEFRCRIDWCGLARSQRLAILSFDMCSRATRILSTAFRRSGLCLSQQTRGGQSRGPRSKGPDHDA